MTEIKYPDAKVHQQISFVKSGMRILGYFLLIWAVPSVPMGIAAGMLVASEVMGIVEELV